MTAERVGQPSPRRQLRSARNLVHPQSYLDGLASVTAMGRDRETLRGFVGSAVVPVRRIEAWTPIWRHGALTLPAFWAAASHAWPPDRDRSDASTRPVPLRHAADSSGTLYGDAQLRPD